MVLRLSRDTELPALPPSDLLIIVSPPRRPLPVLTHTLHSEQHWKSLEPASLTAQIPVKVRGPI